MTHAAVHAIWNSTENDKNCKYCHVLHDSPWPLFLKLIFVGSLGIVCQKSLCNHALSGVYVTFIIIFVIFVIVIIIIIILVWGPIFWPQFLRERPEILGIYNNISGGGLVPGAPGSATGVGVPSSSYGKWGRVTIIYQWVGVKSSSNGEGVPLSENGEEGI